MGVPGIGMPAPAGLDSRLRAACRACRSRSPVPDLNDTLSARIRAALHQNLRPGLALQVAALALLMAWHHWPAARAALEALMAVKLRYGALYSFCTGALFAGVLPRLLMQWMGRAHGPLGPDLLFATLLWGFQGVEVDYFYRLQGWLFGQGSDWATVLVKTLVDQLVFSALWAVPSVSLVYLWKDAGFRWRRTLDLADADYRRRRLPAAIVANWVVWTPTVVVIYLLPAPLQLPVSNMVASFGVLVMLVLLSRPPRALS